MKLSRRDFLKILGLTPAVPFLDKDVFSNVSPSPTDVRAEKPVEKPDTADPELRSGASACFHLPYWGRIRHDNR